MEARKSTPSKSYKLFYQVYPLLLLLLPLILKSVSAVPYKIPRLTPHIRTILRNPDSNLSSSFLSKDFKTYFYTQILDHFNYGPQSYATFKQRYIINFKYWGGGNSSSPIFAYLGAEAPLDEDLQSVGYLTANAPHFKALQVYIEHRYYGKSIPFGSMEEAMKNESIRGYFNSAQAIADYAEVLLHIKEKLSAQDSPIIVIGGSYGGMLASWFRLKYPHIAIGALASSTPVLYFDDITPQNGYYSKVTKDFEEVSKSCYKTIRKSWSEIDKDASKPNGLSILSEKFKTCRHLNNSTQLKDYLDTMYSEAAQYNEPPDYPVTMICSGIDGAPNGTDILGRIFAGVVAYKMNMSCYDTNEYNYPSETSVGWKWQTCSEMVMPIGRGKNDTMFPPSTFDLHQFIADCKDLYGVPPRPHWVTTYFGGHDIKLILRRFASNIIFSNGLRDPYSTGGVLEDILKSVIAVTTVNGSHCLDILQPQKSDPSWLVKQRKKEAEIIDGWMAKYYADLLTLKK
ncbi:lysosomal Pro-X carboxypeptidase [Olea europaea subsp. europaea]|uniref:Lysosomal Pro-X carboxypeptidase n=1 Tax=Olea europaea subsp. europaea TaxID=158383 RepID=A0A8S0VJ45_OLEEU|nr:lysosomal Pro-X carboxypeptidase [Olea europaea subsp. europaea]